MGSLPLMEKFGAENFSFTPCSNGWSDSLHFFGTDIPRSIRATMWQNVVPLSLSEGWNLGLKFFLYAVLKWLIRLILFLARTYHWAMASFGYCELKCSLPRFIPGGDICYKANNKYLNNLKYFHVKCWSHLCQDFAIKTGFCDFLRFCDQVTILRKIAGSQNRDFLGV